MGETRKRQVPQALRILLDLDVAVTNTVCRIVKSTVPQISRTHLKALEISCHGIPWITLWMAFILLLDSPSLYQFQVNFFFGFFLDIVAVAVIKAIVRRRRPTQNQSSDMFLAVGPDKFSFPSGHASRAAFVAHFFISFMEIPALVRLLLLSWSAFVCVSRILLRRHHVLDVLVGFVLGLFESILVGYLWFNQGTCEWLLSALKS